MNKEFVPYEQALALKELGFDEPCLIKDTEQGEECEIYYVHDNGKPTYSQAFRWFREKYEMEGITQRAEDFMWYKWTIYQYNENGKKYVFDWCEYKTYEEAELACLKKLIEIVKK
jgi:hypothetical protein